MFIILNNFTVYEICVFFKDGITIPMLQANKLCFLRGFPFTSLILPHSLLTDDNPEVRTISDRRDSQPPWSVQR